MAKIRRVLGAGLLMFCLVCSAFADDDATPKGTIPPANTQLAHAIVSEGNQTRLQNFFSKASAGDSLVVGVLGGSITEGAACANPKNRYHGVLLDWLKSTFPKAQFRLVNAGIGATGSDYGAMRAERDLLSHKPDLVILDYAVNDSHTKDAAEPYEGVVRQILQSEKHPALILLFMMRKNGSNAQEWESKIGNHYGLPMVSYRDALWPEIQAGRLQWEQISADSVHPNESGHRFAGQLLCAFMDKAFKSSSTATADNPALPEPLISSRFAACRFFDGEKLKPTANHGWVYDGTRKRFAGWKSSTPGSTIEFAIDGEAIYLSYYRLKGAMGTISVSVDGGQPVKYDAWFPQSWGGFRHMQLIAKGLNQGKHKVRVELLEEKNTQSEGYDFQIFCLGAANVVSDVK